jgi:hypothetical protein
MRKSQDSKSLYYKLSTPWRRYTIGRDVEKLDSLFNECVGPHKLPFEYLNTIQCLLLCIMLFSTITIICIVALYCYIWYKIASYICNLGVNISVTMDHQRVFQILGLIIFVIGILNS